MYKPNFCAECGTRLLRLRWHLWTSRKFCDDCARRFRMQQVVPVVVASVALILSGFVIGRSRRPAPPPLTIIRRSDSPLTAPEDPQSPKPALTASEGRATNAPPVVEEEIYLCGAETRKGTPCSRRVHGPVRCWQHKGERAMIPQEKLLVKN